MQAHVDAFEIKVLDRGQGKELLQHIPTHLGRDWLPSDLETIPPTLNPNVEALLDLAQMLIKLSTQIGHTPMVIRREDNFE